jgi:hypothetical protein
MLDERLLGRWKGVVGEEVVTMEFGRDGGLTCTIHNEGKDQKMLLRYESVDGVIVTDQPSDPREERTRYRFTVSDELLLDYDGEVSTFRRA